MTELTADTKNHVRTKDKPAARAQPVQLHFRDSPSTITCTTFTKPSQESISSLPKIPYFHFSCLTLFDEVPQAPLGKQPARKLLAPTGIHSSSLTPERGFVTRVAEPQGAAAQAHGLAAGHLGRALHEHLPGHR